MKTINAIKVMKYVGITIFFLCLSGFTILNATNEYMDLGGTWHFKIDPSNKGVKEKWYAESTNTMAWGNIQVPGNWDTENEYSDYSGKAWYTRSFYIDKNCSEKLIRIVFESVYNDSHVWINGQKVGENHLGFLSFSFNINKYLKYGQENQITLLVDNTFKRGAMWNWGGIRRPVWLEITDRTRLEKLYITSVPNLNSGDAKVDVNIELSNNNRIDEKIGCCLTVCDKSNNIVYEKQLTLNLPSETRQVKGISFILRKSKVKLWHFDSPHLYTCKVELFKDGSSIHELKSRFGIRKIELQGEKLLLNGKLIKTVGFNLVPEDRATGNTLPMWRIMEDVDLMKSMGANMARLSHQSLPESFLDYLDEKGIMTFEEVALWGKDEMVDPEHPTPKEWLERMIKERYNHPSIIGWSVGNEIGYPSMNPKVKEYVEGAIKQAKQLDSTRLAIYVTNSSHVNKDDATVYSDLIMLNRYKNWAEDAETSHQYYPGKPIFYSEFGHEITSEDPNLGKINVTEMLSQMRNKSYIVGASYWTFNDYRSSYSGTPPSGNRSWGVVTITRKKKRAYNQFRKEYAPVEKLDLNLLTNNITIKPRKEGDIPSYILNDYKVVWLGYSDENRLIDGGFQYLGSIKPNEKEINVRMKWKTNNTEIRKVQVSLISALDYSVLDTIVHLSIPQKPQIRAVYSDVKSMRVVYDRSSSATSWKVRYKAPDNSIKETDHTINSFIEIPDLKLKHKYTMELIAVNNKGESEPAIFEVSTSNHEMPPVVWSTTCNDSTCYISFLSTEKDYTYQIQYRNELSEYDQETYLQMPNKGMIKIGGLAQNTTYYIRMRRLMEWGFASNWTHDIKIRTTHKGQPEAPLPIGTIEGRNETILYFDPPVQSDGYIIHIKDKKTGKDERVCIRGSRLNFISLKKEYPNKRFTLSIASTLNGIESTIRNFDN